MNKLIDQLEKEQTLSASELLTLLNNITPETSAYLFAKSDAIRRKYYSNKVYTRGLIEFTNYCKNDCFYCGIRKSNLKASRYRLSSEDILSCCANGYELGFRTFVLQGGEDMYYTDEMLIDLVHQIRENYPDCAITLSVGERSRDSYEKLFAAGANRYLLRHETATDSHYRLLHPDSLSLANRIQCLYHLKDIGYQVGTGFMVGSPYQTKENLVSDLLFIKEFEPAMIGIGPFVPHQDTQFRDEPHGGLELTLFLIGLLRLMNPTALIPATTALGTIDPMGRELGIKAGANVVMPNLSPVKVRKKYSLYDNKICTGEEAAECRLCLNRRMESIGYEIVVDRGDVYRA